MVAYSRLLPIISPARSALVAPVGGGTAGVAVAALFALMPGPMLEDWVWASGIPALIAAAAPPLGTTARAVLALAGGAMAGSVVWSMLYLLFGPGGAFAPRTPANAVPVVRRADAHPDAPPRRPMTADELGTPLMEVAPPPPVFSGERPVPADLDQPLSAFDPAAIRPVPMPPPARVAPIARRPIIAAVPPEPAPALAPGERIETFALIPPPPADPVPRRPSPQPTIDALLRRLEEVSAQRVATAR